MNKRQIEIVWHVDDVFAVRPDLDEEQAMQVLTKIKDKHDAERGVSWDTIIQWADELFPPNPTFYEIARRKIKEE